MREARRGQVFETGLAVILQSHAVFLLPLSRKVSPLIQNDRKCMFS